MKKTITIYVDDCVESIEEFCGTFVLHKATGTTSVHMLNLNFKGKNKVYIPWRGDVVIGKEDDDGLHTNDNI